jgi:hypothetical protein
MPTTVFVGSHQSYREGSSLVVVGEAINGGTDPVFGVTIIATFYDAAGNLIGATESAAFLPQTQRTQRNPFKLQLSNAPSNMNSYQLALRWDEIHVARFDRATVIKEEVQQENGLQIVGEIRNDHRGDLRNLVAVATFYDENGEVEDVARGNVSVTTLPPSGTATFSIEPASPFPTPPIWCKLKAWSRPKAC